MKKKYCDYCEKEIDESRPLFYFWGAHYRLVANKIEGDFCSKSCFLKYIDEKIR